MTGLGCSQRFWLIIALAVTAPAFGQVVKLDQPVDFYVQHGQPSQIRVSIPDSGPAALIVESHGLNLLFEVLDETGEVGYTVDLLEANFSREVILIDGHPGDLLTIRIVPEGSETLPTRVLATVVTPQSLSIPVDQFLAIFPAMEAAGRIALMDEPKETSDCGSNAPDSLQRAGDCLRLSLAELTDNDVLGLSLDIRDHLVALAVEAGDHELALASLAAIESDALSGGRLLVAAYAASRRGFSLTRLGRLAESGSAYDESIEMFETDVGVDLYEQPGLAYRYLAGARFGRCLNAHRLHQLDEAAACYQTLLAEADEYGLLRVQAKAFNSLGGIGLTRGDLGEAFDRFHQSLLLRRQLGDTRGEAIVLQNLGLMHSHVGEHQDALLRLEESLAMERQRGNLAGQGNCMHLIGNVYLNLGDWTRAIAALGESIELINQSGARYKLRGIYTTMARALSASGDREATAEMLQLALGEARNSQSDRNIARAEVYLTEFLLEGSQLVEATAHIEVAQELRGGYDDPGLDADMDRIAGMIANARGLTELGDELLMRSLEGFQRVGNEARVAMVLLEQSRSALASNQLPGALNSIQQAAQLVQTMRPEAVSVQLRTTFSNWRRQIDQQYLKVLIKHAETQPEYLEPAWRVAQASKARSLFDYVGPKPRREMAEVLVNEHRHLLRTLSGRAYRRLNAGQDDLTKAEQRYLETLREVEAFEAKHQLLPDVAPESVLTVAQVQALLESNEVLIEYFLIDQGPALGWMIRADGFEQFTLGDSASLTDAAVEIYQFARQPMAGAVVDQRALSASMANRLGLVDIAADSDVERILVVLDGALHYLPVATLQVPLDGKASRTVPILERFLVTRLPTSDLLARREAADTGPGQRLQTFALLADPVLGLDDPRLPGIDGSLKLAMNDSSRGDIDPDRLTRLPGTEREAQALRQTLKNHDIQVRTGFQVNREWVVSGQLDDYDVIHFATHGIFDDSGSGYSGLALSRYTPGGEELTWLLGAQDIQRMQLHAELVTLSGCETALGREVRGEGLVGITRAFLNAGARQVVASLWPISDRASARLMEAFYSKLIEGTSTPAEALQSAQRQLRENPRYRDPYYWAGFVIQGI